MHHFVGYSEEGHALYRDGCTDDVCALESFVGQIIDLSPPGEDNDVASEYRDMIIARVGAMIPSQQGPTSPPVAQRQGARVLPHSSTDPHYATPPAPQPVMGPQPHPEVPYWACFGRAEGGYYANNPTPGANFEQCAFTREAVQPGEEIAEGYYSGPTPITPIERSSEGQSGILRNIFGAAGRFLTGQWAHGNAPMAGDMGTAKRKELQQRQANQKKQQEILCKKKAQAARVLQGKRDTEARRARCCAAAQDQAAQDQGGGGGGGGGGGDGGYDDGGDYCGDYPQGYPQQAPPGYMYVPGPPPDQDYGDCDGGDGADCDADGVSYAGQAPQGLGEGIGGLLGGALGMFIGAPELTAPLGAGIGGAIQGAACHHGVSPGFAQQQQKTGVKTYTVNGAKVQVHGAVAPDGLFDPATGDMGTPISIVISQANDILRKNGGADAHFGGTRTAGSFVGQEMTPRDAQEIFDDTPRFQGDTSSAVAGFWDDVSMLQDNLSRHAQDAADWTYDQGESAVHYAVGGGPGAKDFGPYSQGTIQGVLQGLRNAGYDVEGGNPYEVDTKQHGVKLMATVHGNGTVTIAIAATGLFVSNNMVWDKVDALMPSPG